MVRERRARAAMMDADLFTREAWVDPLLADWESVFAAEAEGEREKAMCDF
jgi:hypothetical protein